MATDLQKAGRVKRNLIKLRSEWKIVRIALENARKAGSHSPYVNSFVEAARASPYFVGHVDAFMYPVLLVTAALGWVR